jgi:hypothetical protein
MLKSIWKSCGLALAAFALAPQASAVYNATIVGKVTSIQQMGPGVGYVTGTYAVTLDTLTTSCIPGGFKQFVISSATIPDPDTRKAFLAILLSAKAADTQVTIAYDNAGGYCDQGGYGVYYIVGY